MLLGMLLSVMLSAMSAHAQTARVALPVNVQGMTPVTGAVGAVPGAPAGASALIPANTPMPPTGVIAALVPVLLSPFVGRKTAPSDGQAGAMRPARSESLSESAPAAPTTPMAASRKELSPPEPGRLAPSAVTAGSRHSPTVSANGTPEAQGPTRTGDGEENGPVGDAGRRLRLAVPWLKPGASTDEILRVMDSLFGGRFPPGKATARKYASMLLDGFAQTRPAGTTNVPSWAEGSSALTPALDAEWRLLRQPPRPKRERENREGGISFGSGGAAVAGAGSFTHVDPLFGMRLDGNRPRVSLADSGFSVASVEETRTPAPPRLLRLDRLELEAEEDAALGLRIMDSPVSARAVSVEDAAAAAGLALQRQAGEASESADRVLGGDTPLLPSPPRFWHHGWLPFWTAAAASRLVLARSY